MMKIRQSLLLVALLALAPVSAFSAPAAEKAKASAKAETAAPAVTIPADANLPPEVRARLERVAAQLTPQTGDIRIPSANAVLHLGENYYFLPAEQARAILVDAWGNPPQAASDVLGIVFPAGKTFVDNTWGAVITFQDSGYVSDDDAEATDYNEILAQIHEAEPSVNAQRTAQGYPAQHLVGWAQPPVYDRATHSVVWAQNIQITGDTDNSLNYDIRLLGRRGVLSLNMVTVMSQLAETRAAAQSFAASAEFESGSRYADYQSGDRVAEYGVGGLVAAGVGVAVAKKAGFLAVLLIFLKKFGIFIVAGIALAFGALRKLFRREEEPVYYEEPEWAEPEPEPHPAEDGPVTLDKG